MIDWLLSPIHSFYDIFHTGYRPMETPFGVFLTSAIIGSIVGITVMLIWWKDLRSSFTMSALDDTYSLAAFCKLWAQRMMYTGALTGVTIVGGIVGGMIGTIIYAALPIVISGLIGAALAVSGILVHKRLRKRR